MHMYHDANGQFPAGYGYAVNGIGAYWPWTMRILPFLEQTALEEQVKWGIDPGLKTSIMQANNLLGLVSAQLPAFQCPSDALTQEYYNTNESCWSGWPQKGRCSYGTNMGIGQQEATIDRNVTLRPTGTYTYDTYGVTSAKLYPGPFGKNYGASIAQIRDGTSCTLMIAELIVGKKCTPRGTVHSAVGVVVQATYTPNDLTPDITGECDNDDKYTGDAPCTGTLTTNAYNLQHTSRSRHPGGVNVTMCDGSAQFVSQSISRSVWQAMATPDVGEPVLPDF